MSGRQLPWAPRPAACIGPTFVREPRRHGRAVATSGTRGIWPAPPTRAVRRSRRSLGDRPVASSPAGEADVLHRRRSRGHPGGRVRRRGDRRRAFGPKSRPQPLPPRPGYAQPDARARRGRRAAAGRARRRAVDLPRAARRPLAAVPARGRALAGAAVPRGARDGARGGGVRPRRPGALDGEHGEAVALALAGLLEVRGLSAAARVLARWGSFALRPGTAASEHGDT